MVSLRNFPFFANRASSDLPQEFSSVMILLNGYAKTKFDPGVAAYNPVVLLLQQGS